MQPMLFIVQLIARSLPNIANNLEICNLPAFVVGALVIKRFPRLRIVRRRRRHPRQKIQQQHGGKDPDPEFLLHPHTLLEIIYFSPLWHTHQKYNMPRRETQQQKNSRPMKDDCFYWCARGGTCPPCAAAGRESFHCRCVFSGSYPTMGVHTSPSPFRDRWRSSRSTPPGTRRWPET